MQRRWLLVVPILTVVLADAGAIVWHELSRVHAVSVSAAVDRYRGQHSQPDPAVLAGPVPGVYVFATHGSERITAGGIRHTYPQRTTLTVAQSAGCLQLRWDALAERWMQWQLCSTAQGWRLSAYTDVHKFLYLEDRQDYRCDSEPVVFPVEPGGTSFTCTTAHGTMAIGITTTTTQPVVVAGAALPASHLHLALHATGASTNDGAVDVWVRTSDALPLRADVVNHGHQIVLGSDIYYDEAATFALTSTTPLQ